jgi:hypothetical protein
VHSKYFAISPTATYNTVQISTRKVKKPPLSSARQTTRFGIIELDTPDEDYPNAKGKTGVWHQRHPSLKHEQARRQET